LRIAVCIAQVPDTATRVQVEGAGIVEGAVSSWIVSPYDEFAVEEALRIKEAGEADVVVFSLGPERAQAAIRTALAMGADSGVHLQDPSFEGLDTLATARALAAALRKQGPFDLILTGQQGVGGDHSQVPGLLAEMLDLPSVTMAVKLELRDGGARVEREIEGAHEHWETTLPAVVSAQKGLNEPRYANLKGIMQAKKKPIARLGASELGLDAAALAPRTRVLELALPASRPQVTMIEGDPATQSRELIRLLHEEAKVL
jgi:electron transfer flavoprotein beta subunit